MHSFSRRFSIAAPATFLGFLAVFAACTTESTDESNNPGGGTSTSSGNGTSSGTSSGTSGTSGSSGTSGTSGTLPTANLTWTKGTVTGADVDTIGGIAAMAYGGGKWVALAKARTPLVGKSGYALTSDDGKTWKESATFPLNYNIASLVYTGSGFAASGIGPVEGIGKPFYATTPDGVTWTFTQMADTVDTASTSIVTAVGTNLHFAGQKGLMAYKSSGEPAPYTSPFVGTNAFVSCVIGSRVIITGQADASKPTDPLFIYSDDVSSSAGWKAGTEPSVPAREANRFTGLACDETRQIAVGAGNEVWVSTDKGATWAVGNPNGDSTTWRRIEKVGAKYVLVGWKGVYGVTTTGTDLSAGTLPDTERNLESSATDGTLIVAGASGLYNEPITPDFWYAQP